MLIPSIDLQGGRVVQLVQGERLAIASSDIEGWIRRFEGFPAVQLIDLDAAKSAGSNAPLIQLIARRLPCRVGGGVRTAARAMELLEAGAHRVILGSALFRDGKPDLEFAAAVADRAGRERLIAAVDARGGLVAVDGWRRTLALTPQEAVRQLDSCFDEFLFTNIDREGLMQGIDRASILGLRDATDRRLTVAGGVTTTQDIEWLHDLGIDAVVGMAIYSGKLEATPPASLPSNPGGEENR